MKIALNAHLLSGTPGYRSAGIHGYIDGTLRHLSAAAAEHAPSWTFTVYVGGTNPRTYPGLTMRRAPFATESPAARILWEQAVQPFSLISGEYALVHGMAFASPVLNPVPAVVTVYDLSFVHHPERLTAMRRLYLRFSTPLSVRRARRVIAISYSTARDLTATLGTPPGKIDVAAPGHDPQVFRPLPHAEIEAFRAAKGLPERFWLFIGTLEPRKNLVTLIEAYAALDRAHRLPLVIGGGKGWDYQPIFDAVARHRLEADIHFPGFIPADELQLWYNAANVFLYPSVFEGFGLPVLEAMACGTPVVISDASSLPEVAGDAGIAVPPHDVQAWTAALRRIHQDESWRAGARERGQANAARYTWKVTAAAAVSSYRKALKEIFS
ncbi:MAG: glycosyltransferase family 1 protein [bacterium]|nr:glycosyltransferase family 1 protein [bacterium]